MNTFVKKFIENTSYVINMNMWPVFFYEWYRECAKIWPPLDEEKELFNILKQAGIPVDWDARKIVITEATKQNIEKVLNNLDEWNGDNIPISYLANELTTHLGLGVYTLVDCVDVAATAYKLQPLADKTGYRIPGR